VSAEQALEYYRAGEKIVASLLLGYYLENRLKAFTLSIMGRSFTTLSDGLKEMEQGRLISQFRKDLFYDLMGLRNKAIHQPTMVAESDFKTAIKKVSLLEESVP
jgi:hypothetical protein